MANEFVVKNGLISQGNIAVTGSMNVTGPITASFFFGSASYALTASYAMNGGSGGGGGGGSGYWQTSSINNNNIYPTTSGNVGIGTNNPTTLLQVQGTVSASFFSSSANNSVGFIGTSSYAISSSEAQTGYNGNRSIKRTGYSGINVGGTSLKQFIENFFFPFIPATVSLSNTGTYYYETGSTQSPNIAANITVNDEVTFGSSSILRDSLNIYNTSNPSPNTFNYTDTNISSSHTYQAFTQTNNNGSPTIISSGTETISFIYPYLHGVSATEGLSGTALYSAFSPSGKDITINSSKTYTYSGNTVYLYFCYPSSYADLTSILDPNSFQVIGSFQYSGSVSVTSTGLTNNWTNTYKVYRTTLTSSPSGDFKFT
jgi:hypothetical protein